MLGADWIKRKIENTTELKFPVTAITVIPIRCADGYMKSGSDAVICLQNTTFYGVDDVLCFSKCMITFPL